MDKIHKLKKIEKIDKKIIEIQNDKWNQGNLHLLFLYIENRLRLSLDLEDLNTFRYYVSHLDLSEDDKLKGIYIRNRNAHNILSDNELSTNKKWIKEVLIPSVLKFKPKKLEMGIDFYKSVEKKIHNYLIKNLDFNVIRNKRVKRGTSIFVVDLFLENENNPILIEIKNSVDLKKTGIEQLSSYLFAFNSSIGILILPTNIIEEINMSNARLLIFGIENNLDLLAEWIKNNFEIENK